MQVASIRPFGQPFRRVCAICLTVFMLIGIPVYSAYASGSGNVVTLTLDQRGILNVDRETKLFGGAGRYLPTGVYKRANEQLIATVSATDQNTYPSLVISDPVLQHYTHGDQDGIPLKEGRNVITDPRAGIVYFINESEKTERPPVVTIEGGVPFAFFVLGQHTRDDWHRMLDQYSDVPAVELVGERVLVTASYGVGRTVDDPQAILEAIDEAVEVLDKLSGLYPDDPNPIHRPSLFRQHMRESADGYMYKFNNHTGFRTDAFKNVLQPDNFKYEFFDWGWGPWHELGHTYQQDLWTWTGTTEVTSNIYAMAIERHFNGDNKKIVAQGIYDEAFRYMDTAGRDYHALESMFAKVVMFWQLELAFGPDFYPTLHRLYRELPESERPVSDNEKVQTFIVMASKVADRDLTPFFRMWGLPPSAATLSEISSLPEMTEPIWRLTGSGYKLPAVSLQAEGYGSLGVFNGATLTGDTPVKIVAPELSVAEVRVSVDETIIYEGTELPEELILRPHEFPAGKHAVSVVVVDRQGRTYRVAADFAVQHFKLIAPRRPVETAPAERLTGTVTLEIEPLISTDVCRAVAVWLERVDGASAVPGMPAPPKEIPVYSGPCWPRDLAFDTLPIEDGAYDLVVTSETVNGVRAEIRERVVIDNWDVVDDEILPPQVSAWFGSIDQLKAVDRSDGWAYATEDGNLFFGDTSRMYNAGDGDQYLVWKNPGLTRFDVIVYARTETIGEAVRVEVSGDGQAWIAVDYAVSVTAPEAGYELEDCWLQAVLTGSVPGGVDGNYLRVTIAYGHGKDALQLGHVRMSSLKVGD